GLEKVALDQVASAPPISVRHLQELVIGDKGRLVRSEVAEHHTTALLAGIGEVLNGVLEARIGRLQGLIQAAAGGVVEPAVVVAANAVILDLGVREIGTPMGAAPTDEPKV